MGRFVCFAALALASLAAHAQAPPALVASDGLLEDRVALSWTLQAPAGSFLRVQRDGQTLTALAAGTTAYEDRTATLDQHHTYRVVVVSGGAEGAAVQDVGWRAARQVAGVVASQGTSPTNVTVRWQDRSAIESGYRLYRDGALLATLDANSILYTDAPPAQGVAYTYCVAALFGTAEGTQACAAGATSGGATVSSVSASDAAFPDRVEIAWTDGGAAPDGYLVRRDGGVAALVDGTAAAATDAAAVPGQTHTYGVQRVTGDAGQAALFNLNRGGFLADYDPGARGRFYGDCAATVEGWVRRSDVTRSAAVFQTVGGTGTGAYRLAIGDGRLSLTVQGSDGQTYAVTGGTVRADEWTHVAFSRACPGDGTFVLTLFVNGTEGGRRVVPGVAGGTIGGYPQQWILGDNLPDGTPYSETWLDDVRHWNVARTSAQLRETMFRSLDAAPGLVASFDMEGHLPVLDPSVGNQDPRSGLFRLDEYQGYGVPAVPLPRDTRPAREALRQRAYAEAASADPFSTCSGTAEAWVRPDAADLTGRHHILGTGRLDGPGGTLLNGYTLLLRDGAARAEWRYATWEAGGGGVLWLTSGPLQPYTWAHVAFAWTCTQDGNGTVMSTDYRLFVNGQLAGSHLATQIGSRDALVPGERLVVGGTVAGVEGPESRFNGDLDEVRMWSRGLAPAEVAARMRRAPAPGEPGLAAYFPMEGGAAGLAATGLTLREGPTGRPWDQLWLDGALSPAVTDAGSVAAPAAPTDVAATDAATAPTDAGVMVSWSAGGSSTGARVWRADGAGVAFDPATFGLVATTTRTGGATQASTLDATASVGTLYTYCVEALAGDVPSAAVCDTGSRAAVVAPTAVAAADGTSETTTTVTWQSASTTAAFFEVRRGDTVLATLPPDARSYADAAGVAGTVYTYCVAGVSALEARSADACDSGRRELAAPTSVAATDEANEGYVEVTWTDRSAVEDGYVVTRRAGDAPAVEVGRAGRNETSLRDRTGDPGVTYTYAVAAVQATGGVEGRSAAPTDAGRRVFRAPAALAASDGTDERTITLSWTDRSGVETAYVVTRLGEGGAEEPVVRLPANATGYVHDLVEAGLPAGAYTYRVRAEQARPAAAPGAPWASAAAEDAGASRLLAPADVRVAPLAGGGYSLAWVDRSAMESGYAVTRDEAPLATLGAGAQAFADAAATGVHAYCVRATGAGGGASDEVCVRTSADPPFNPNPTFTTVATAAPVGGEGIGTIVAGDGDVLATLSGGTADIPTTWLTVFERNGDQWQQVYRVSSNDPLGQGGFGLNQYGFGGVTVSNGTVAAMKNNSARDVLVVRRNGAGPGGSGPGATWVGTVAFSVFTDAEPVGGTMQYGNHLITALPSEVPEIVVTAMGGTFFNTQYRSVLWTLRNGTWQNVSRADATISGVNHNLVAVQAGPVAGVPGEYSLIATGGLDDTGQEFPGYHPWADFRIWTSEGNRRIDYRTLSQQGGGRSFGWDVAVAGDVMAVAAPNLYDDSSIQAGVNVYRLESTNWRYAYTVTVPGDALRWFGEQIEIVDGTLVATGYDRATGEMVLSTYSLATGDLQNRVRPGGTIPPSRSDLRPQGRGRLSHAASAIVLGNPAAAVGETPGAGDLRLMALTPPPSAVTATDGQQPSNVVVRWQDETPPTAPNNEVAFRVYRDGTVVGETAADATSYTDNAARPGDVHRYCVAALGDGFAGAESEKVCDLGWRPADGAISGRVVGGLGGGIDSVYVHLGPAPGGAVLLDGAGGHLEALDSPDLQAARSALTVEAWVRLSQAGAAEGETQFIAGTASFALAAQRGTDGQARLVVTSRNGGASLSATGGVIAPGVWTHVAGTLSPSGVVAVVDGVGTAAAGAAAAAASAAPFAVGRDPRGVDGPLRGALVDEVRVWGVARTAAQIAGAAAQRLSGTETGLVAYWPLDETSGEGRANLAGAPGRHYLLRQSGAHATRFGAPLPGYALTDMQGRFAFTGLRYGTGRTFRLAPSVTPEAPVYGEPEEGNRPAGPVALGGEAFADTAEGDALYATLFGTADAEARAADAAPRAADGAANGARTALDAGARVVLDGGADGLSDGLADGLADGLTPASRTFSPRTIDVRLSREAPIENGVQFTDVSAFTVSGRVVHGATQCPVENATVLVDGQESGMTDSDGRYAVALQPGIHTVALRLGDAQFHAVSGGVERDEPDHTVDVQGPLPGLDFVGITRRPLVLSVLGAHGAPVAETVRLRVRSTSGCYDNPAVDVTAAQGGTRQLDLAPDTYVVSFVSATGVLAPLGAADVTDFLTNLGSLTADLTVDADSAALVYHAPLSVTVEGLPAPPEACTTAPVPVLPQLTDGQRSRYPLTIRVFEDYGSAQVPASEGTVSLLDGISDRASRDSTLTLDGGVAEYTVVPGFANVLQGMVVDGVDRSYQKRLYVTADVAGRQATADLWALVEGVRPREGYQFFTSPIATPLMVLRDPPGDGSSAAWERGETVCSVHSLDLGQRGTVEFDLFVQLGFQGDVGVGVEGDIEVWRGIGGSVRVEAGSVSQHEWGACATAEETISTSDNPDFVGPDADVFVGVGMNYVFAVSDRLHVDRASCAVETDDVVVYAPAGIESGYVYTRGYLRDALLPRLDSLATDPNEREARASAALWRQHLEAFPAVPPFSTTGSPVTRDTVVAFSAGTVYTQTTGSGTFDTRMQGLEINVEGFVGTQFVGLVAGTGGHSNLSVGGIREEVTLSGRTYEDTRSFTYTLLDDDPGDSYLTRVVGSPVFNAPAFEVLAGYSSCPYEPWRAPAPTGGAASLPPPDGAVPVPASGSFYDTPDTAPFVRAAARTGLAQEDALTAAAERADAQARADAGALGAHPPTPLPPRTTARDKPLLALDRPAQTDVPADEAAAFTLYLMNDSPSGEARVYTLRTLSETNPNGAQLRVNGEPFSQGLRYTVAPGQTQQLMLEVRRGPTALHYDSLGVQVIPACSEVMLPTGEPDVSAEAYVSVTFAPPAGALAFADGAPADGWLVSAGRPALDVAVVGIDPNPTDTGVRVTRVGLQARRVGDGSGWADVLTTDAIPADGRWAATWSVGQLGDGAYAVRAFARSTAPGGQVVATAYTAERAGRIDRTAPLVFGAPEPADGVLAPADAIAVTFSEALDRDSLVTSGLEGRRNVLLREITGPDQTGPLVEVSAVLSAAGDRLVVTPAVPGALLHGHTYEAVVRRVVDLAGNRLADPVAWRFVAVQAASGLAWSPAATAVHTPVGQGATASATLVNAESVALTASLASDAAWLAVPASVTLGAGGTVPLALAVPATLAAGEHTATVTATAGPFSAALSVRVFVHAPGGGPPAWAVVPAQFEHSMTAVARVMRPAGGVAGPGTVVGAFVGDDVRGVAAVQRTEGLGDLAFLTIHSPLPSGEALTFRVYDPVTDSVRTGYVLADGAAPVAQFDAGTAVGSPTAPATLRPPGDALVMNLLEGWTWISTNRVGPTALNVVFSGIGSADGDVVKSATAFSMFDATGGTGWGGTLTDLVPGQGYLVRLAAGQPWTVDGPVGDVSLPVPVNDGWTWIGYRPSVALPLGAAFASHTFAEGDLLKGQLGFAHYVAGGTWSGSLTTLEPGRAYKLWTSAAGEIVYAAGPPAKTETPAVAERGDGALLAAAQRYERSFALTAAVPLLPAGVAPGDAWLQALAPDGELRGQTRLVATEGAPLAFLLAWGDTDGERLALRLAPADSAAAWAAVSLGEVAFLADGVAGTPSAPVTLQAAVAAQPDALPDVLALLPPRPNPARGAATVAFTLPAAAEVRVAVYDVLGREVAVLAEGAHPAGLHTAALPAGALAPGTYVVRLASGGAVQIRSLTIVR